MSDASSKLAQLYDLVGTGCEEMLTMEQSRQLESLVLGDETLRYYYILYMQIHALAEMGRCPPAASETAHDETNSVGLSFEELSHNDVRPSSSVVPYIHSNTIHGVFGYFSSGWLMAYLAATVIVGLGITIAAVVHVSQPVQIVTHLQPIVEQQQIVAPKAEIVGRITGMVGCKWEDRGQWSVASGQKSPESESSSHQPLATNHLVALGDRLALRSGLIEITYDTGAKVILQGPVTYEVESAAGGYLSVGKLTAKLEKKGTGIGDQRSETANQKSEIRNQKSLSPDHCPLFSVRTPTATITDLGTEFGVEVSSEGKTTSYVFRGMVRVQAIGHSGKPEGTAQLLGENESAQVDGNQGHGKITVVPAAKSNNPAAFVREILKPTHKVLDLVDVVAGGNGFSGRRNAGIDPTTGRLTNMLDSAVLDDGKYHRVASLPFVDGVFIPDGRTGQAQIDSAGHSFEGFPATAHGTAGCIWAAGGVIPYYASGKQMGMIPTVLGNTDYSLAGHGVLFLHANKGITFDLEAIRRANPNWRLTRFHAVGGNAAADSVADLWVFVDGQPRFFRRQISGGYGACPITISLGEEDRFLTLAATDGGDGVNGDWIIFCDPRLGLVSANKPDGKTSTKSL